MFGLKLNLSCVRFKPDKCQAISEGEELLSYLWYGVSSPDKLFHYIVFFWTRNFVSTLSFYP